MASNARQQAILEGVAAAQRLHAELGIRDIIAKRCSHIDVFGAALQMGAVLLFKPLDGLLGAFLGQPTFPLPGIIVSTQRELHVQRFTAAHELGHMMLNHQPSLDEHVGLWRGENHNLQEVAADAFASEFLLPKWLFVAHAQRNLWKKAQLEDPMIAYQLSLRLGVSYEATCWGLQSHHILSPTQVKSLQLRTPKELKKAALAERAQLSNSWANVWVLTERDNGFSLQGGPDDLFVFRFNERAAAGYLWAESELRAHGFEIVADLREMEDSNLCGGDVVRVLIAKVGQPSEYHVVLSEQRPWCPNDRLSTISMDMDLQGKERGMPRHARMTVAEA